MDSLLLVYSNYRCVDFPPVNESHEIKLILYLFLNNNLDTFILMRLKGYRFV